VLNDLLINQEKFMKTESVNLSSCIFPQTESVRDQFMIKQLKEIDKQGFMDRDPDLTK
jgi:hypothetical protein